MNSDLKLKIVKPSGILDSTKAAKFRQTVSQSIDQGIKSILIDFQDVTFMDSSGLGALVICLKTTRSSNVKLYLCSINDQIRMLFELTSMDKVFEIFSDQEAFNDAILEGKTSKSN